MPDPLAVTTRTLSGADADVISAFYPVPGLGFVPINCFVLHAEEPVLVDTSALFLRDQVFAAVSDLIDLGDLRWIYLTHADPDHVGCLLDVLAAAPDARIVLSQHLLGRLGLYQAISPERVYLLNPGQRLSVGDRELEAVAPVTFDAPETTGVLDTKTRALFSSDSFGGVVAGPVEDATDISPTALRDGVSLWATVDSPWLSDIEPAAFDAKVNRFRKLAPPIVLSTHLPPAFGLLDDLLEAVTQSRTRPRYIGPDQAALTAVLASFSAQPESQPHA